jgi:acetolactate synthase-1/2/3 large subunit
MRALQEQFVTPGAAEIHGDVDMAEVAATVGRIAPENSVVVCDSGTFARWVHRYYPWRRPETYGGPATGAMGYAVPGAIGIKLARPATPVIAFVGDGGFQMTGQEMMTAAEHDIPIKVIVCDNRAWGSMMQSQTEVYGADRRFATALAAPDFCKLAQAYGAAAFRVERTGEFAEALNAALAHPGPALVHLVTDPRDITPFGPWDP